MASRFYTREQQATAQQAAARYTTWAHGFRHEDGLQFVNFASSTTPGVIYHTHMEGLGCTCPRGKRKQNCWHQLAAQIATEQARALKPRKSYEDLFSSDDDTLEDSF